MATYRARVAVEESNHTFQLFQPDAYSCARCPDQWTSPWSGSTGHGGCDWNACYSDPLGSSLFAPHYRWLGSSNAIARRGKVCSCALLPWEDNNRNNKNYTLEDKNIYTPSLRAVPIRNIYIYIFILKIVWFMKFNICYIWTGATSSGYIGAPLLSLELSRYWAGYISVSCPFLLSCKKWYAIHIHWLPIHIH